MRVKQNQPLLLDAIRFWFDRPRRYPDQDERFAQQVTKGHGRRVRYRLWATTALNAYLDWPDVHQAFHLERAEYLTPSQTEPRLCHHYGITSLSPQHADALTLLTLWRQHWGVESLHWVRDTLFAEDLSRTRTGSAPETLAALRNLTISALRLFGYTALKAARQHFAAHFDEALAFIGIT